MQIEIYVTAYVFKYLKATYSEGPYIISRGSNDLRLALEFLSIRAEIPPFQLGKLGGHKVTLDLGENSYLAKLATRSSALLRAGTFFHYEFNLALRRYIQSQADMSKELGLSAYEWSRERSIKTFFQKYGITERDYPLESAYRQSSRKKEADMQFLSEKLRKKFSFSGSGKEEFRAPRLVSDGRGRPALLFFAYSREKEDLKRCRLYVPSRIRGTEKEPIFLNQSSRIITTFLLKGQSVA